MYEIIVKLILVVLLFCIIYAIAVYVLAMCKKISIRESRHLFWETFFEIMSCPAGNAQLSQEDTADILSKVQTFSALDIKNTRWEYHSLDIIPFIKVEILDTHFLEDWGAIEGNICIIIERMFAYNGVSGIYYVTYERTLKKDQYYIIVYWATARKSVRALQKKCQSISDYQRKINLSQNAPYTDRDLEAEMDETGKNDTE